MRGWLPEDLVDELEQMDEHSLQPIAISKTLEIIDELSDGDVTLAVAVMHQAEPHEIIRFMFVLKGRFLQYDVVKNCSCSSDVCLLSTRGRTEGRHIRDLPDGWVDLPGESDLLCDANNLTTMLVKNALWLVNPTVH